MAGNNENLHNNAAPDGYSLESILAEYKGSAYINGDKKTPPELLKEQADRIIMEAVGKTQPDPLFPDGYDEYVSGGAEASKASKNKEFSRVSSASEVPKFPEVPEGPEGPVASEVPVAAETPGGSEVSGKSEVAENPGREKPSKGNDNVILFFDSYQKPAPEPQDSIVRDVEKAIEREMRLGEGPSETLFETFGPFERAAHGDENPQTEETPEVQYFDEPYITEDEVFAEPDLRDAAVRFDEAYKSMSLRSIPAAFITLIMVILTFAFEAGMTIPFNIGRNQGAAAGALVLAMLVVMMLYVDIIIRGASNLVRGSLNVETLIVFSCAFSFISGVFSIVKDESGILPYCAVSALSLTCAAFGEKYNLRAITETLKTASGSAEPYGVQAEYNAEINKSVLKKAYNRTDGFYNNLMHPDVTETMYRYAAPILLAAALVLSIIAALAGGQGQYFLHILSAMLAAAVPFSSILAFSVPFRIVAKSIRKSGAAIAGWGGTDDICYTDGACVTDNDLFPPGTLKFNGVKLFESVSPEKAIRYTASLIVASGSGLSRMFSEALDSQGMKLIHVEDFACYEGGVGALIRGENVMTGSAAFMNLLGIRIPEDMNMKNAVFTAIDNDLAAMFAIDYEPQKSVQSALISILRWRVKLFFAVRDFNVTPLMLEQKFRVSLEDIEYIQAKDSYSISDATSGKEGRMAAVLTREGLSPFAEAVTGGRLLKSSALVTAAVSVISAAVGVLFMFYICWSGAFVSAKPGNLIVFMAAMLAAVLIVCGYAKFKK